MLAFILIHNFVDLPSLSILLFPIGIRKSGERASSEISKEDPYIISFSKQTTAIEEQIVSFKVTGKSPLKAQQVFLFKKNPTFLPVHKFVFFLIKISCFRINNLA